jgi:putative ABC transport system permease protein
MTIFDAFRIALEALSANRMRSALTVLGLVIGVGAVIALMAMGRGSEAAVTSRIQSLGSDLLFVRSNASRDGRVSQGFGSGSTLNIKDAEALADAFAESGRAMVAPEVGSRAQIVAGRENVRARITGVTPEYEFVRNFGVSDGEFVSQNHVDRRAMVAILGSAVAETLFGNESPVGERVRIDGKPFTVIGVLESKGSTGLGFEDDLVMAPITTVQQRLSRGRTVRGSPRVSSINVQAANSEVLDEVMEEIAAVLRREHRILGDDDFSITSQEETLAAFREVTATFTIFLGAIAGISLLVGGIGVMNIMLVSVTERTREIGIRKAIGARQRDVLMQFLLEASLLSLVGGGVGVLAGWGMGKAMGYMELNGQRIETLIQADIVFLALAVSVAIGLFFGIYPAMRASRLDPIEALRHE